MYMHPDLMVVFMNQRQAELLAHGQRIHGVQQCMPGNPPPMHWLNAMMLFFAEGLIKAGTIIKKRWLIPVDEAFQLGTLKL